MIETDLLRRVGYDPTLRSGSDYNLGVRLMRAGARMVHTGEYHIMRRLHDRQMTTVDPVVQKTSAVLSSFMARNGMLNADTKALRDTLGSAKAPVVRGSGDVTAHVGRYLPDHLVGRLAVVRVPAGAEPSGAARDVLSRAGSRVHVLDDEHNGFVDHVLTKVQWAELAALATARLDVTVHDDTSDTAQEILSGALVSGALRRLRLVASRAEEPVVVVVRHQPGDDRTSGEVDDLASVTSPLGARSQGSRVVHTETGAIHLDALAVDPSADLLDAMSSLGSALGASSVTAAAQWTHEELAARLAARATPSADQAAQQAKHLNGRTPA
jgi:hypothetical protein